MRKGGALHTGAATCTWSADYASILLFALLLIGTLKAGPSRAQPAASDTSYRVYTGEGKQVALDDVLAAMEAADVVFIGETHDDPTAHALQHELLRTARRRYGAADTAAARSVTLSLEMFERDVQSILDEYLAGLITEEHFLASSHPWSGYRSAYRPLVEFAKANDLAVLAANAPRRYVNRVARLGPSALDTLPPTAKQWLPPLPPPAPSPDYRAKWDSLTHSTMAVADDSAGAPSYSASADTTVGADSNRVHAHHGPAMAHMLQAQVLWDATMAYTLATYLMKNRDTLILHVTGGFHVSKGTGTPEQLTHYRPSAAILIVMIRPVDDIGTFNPSEHSALGDFVILTDAARRPARRSIEASH